MAEEDIFMEYTGSSDSEKVQTQLAKIQFNIPKIGNNFDEILLERSRVSSDLRKSSASSNTLETRVNV